MRDAGIAAGAFVMAGAPGESAATIRQTVSLLKRARPDMVIPQIALILPGNLFESQAITGVFFDPSFWHRDDPAPYYAMERDLKRLMAWQGALAGACQPGWRTSIQRTRDLLATLTGLRLSRRGIGGYEAPGSQSALLPRRRPVNHHRSVKIEPDSNRNSTETDPPR